MSLKVIITTAGTDGRFAEVGMNARSVHTFASYEAMRRSYIASDNEVTERWEVFQSDRFYGDPWIVLINPGVAT